jgi:hypothetical protein
MRRSKFAITNSRTRFLGALLLTLFVACGLIPGALGGIVLIFLSIPLLFILLNGTIYGVWWAILIADTITKEREQGTYELLSISPVGTLGTRWLIGTGCLHRNRALEQAHMLVVALMVIALVTLGVMMFIVSINLDPAHARSLANREDGQMLLTATWVVLFVVGLYIDHAQSIVLGSLAGMLAPSYVKTRFDARVWGAGVFLIAQVSTYTVFWLSAIILLPSLFDAAGIRGILADIGLPVLRLLVFYAVREGAIILLWRRLARQLNADASEVALATRSAA